MAGSPKKRARIEAQKRQAAAQPARSPRAKRSSDDDEIPDAVPSRAPARAPAPAHHARALHETEPARPLRPAPTPLRHALIGAGTRAAADDAQAETMRHLAELIKPGVEVRIERSRPTWATGWIEDYPIASVGDGLQDLYQHLRDEHGGQLYKLTVLASGQHPVYVGSVAIAGPVKVGGRIVGREAFEPPARDRQPAAAAPSAPAAQPFDLGAIVALAGQALTAIMSSQKESAQLQIEAVRDMVRSSQKQTSELTSAVLQVRSDERDRTGIAGQLGELAEAFTAMDAVRKRFGAAKDAEPTDEMQGALAEATKGFLSNVMTSMATRQQPPRRPRLRRPAPPPGPIRSVRPSHVVGEHSPGIPDAIAGQIPRTN